jgi:hypothetical protein
MSSWPRLVCNFVFLLAASLVAAAVQPKPEALQAWRRYIELTEARIERQQQQHDPANFLFVAGHSPAQVAGLESRLKHGEVVIEKLKTTDDGKTIEPPGALIHHWVGTAFIPGTTIQQTFDLLQDYDHHAVVYAPDVQQSKLISHNGDDFTAYLRFVKKKVITVVLDTYHQAHYAKLDATHAYSRSYTTKVAEIENAGTAQEREKSADEEDGFMWKMNTYWRFEERDGGLYIQCEAITLTRSVPFGLAWAIEPFITSIPKESLTSTMVATRNALSKSAARD